MVLMGDPLRDDWHVVRTAPKSYLRGTPRWRGITPGWPRLLTEPCDAGGPIPAA